MKAIFWTIAKYLVFVICAVYFNIVLFRVHWQVLDSGSALNLILVYLATAAFIATLYSFYAKDDRLRANSENLLLSLMLLSPAPCLTTIGFFLNLTAAAPKVTPLATALGHFMATLGLECYLASMGLLLTGVFLKNYNQIYNLRTDKFLKHFGPILRIRRSLNLNKKAYELKVSPRTSGGLGDLEGYFSADENARILQGSTILLITSSYENAFKAAFSVMISRVAQGETANFVTSERHPWTVWDIGQHCGINDNTFIRDFVFIDAYTPSFGFTDEILEAYSRVLNEKGIRIVPAKTFAGLHTSTNTAFNVIKSRATATGQNDRKPMVMVYSATSALCEFESKEQFRIFWRHVIPAERIYKMITLIIESIYCSDDLLAPLRELADFVVEWHDPISNAGKRTK